MVLAVVLGSAAGGGFPQWNSNAPACRRARDPPASPSLRSQYRAKYPSTSKQLDRIPG
jgi:phosphoribosyl 1,2-cyclic phosphodiesterase